MGLIGTPRSEVSEKARRRAYLKHAQEVGFKDGLLDRRDVGLYMGDQEARDKYLFGKRLGREQKERQ